MVARIARIFLLLVAVQALFAGSAGAATWTWDGSQNQSWDEPLNWNLGTVPTSGAPGGTEIVFPANATSTMDILGGITVDKLTFNGSGTTINGDNSNALRLKAGTSFVMSPGVTNITLGANLPVVVQGPGTVTFSLQGGSLKFEGTVGGTADMNLIGGTTITVGHAGSLATSGIVNVSGGTLELDNNGLNQAVKSGQLVIGLGQPVTTTLKPIQATEIAENTDVFVNADGHYNMNGSSEIVGNLSVRDNGKVTVNAPTSGLDVNGTLSMIGGTIEGAQRLKLVGGGVAATSTAAAPATINTLVNLGPDGAFFQVSNGPLEEDMIILKPFSGGGPNAFIDKGSSGRLALKQPSANTYDGGLSILDGQVRLAGTSGLAVPPGERVFVGNGLGAGGTASLEIAQANAILDTSPVDVLSDGLLSLSANQSVASLNVAGGRVTGTGSILVPQVTGTAGGVVESDLVASQATTLSAGEGGLTVTGIKPGGGFAGGFAKTGAGTLTQTGTNTLAGTTDIQTGTFVANGTQTAPVQVASGATLSGAGTVGATTVAGTLAPSSPALTTGDLTFASTGKLAIAGPASGALPRVNSAGSVSIDPAAQLDLQVVADPIAPAGTQLQLIGNDGADAITGRFGNASDGTVFTGGSGQQFSAGYGLGDGNDLGLTAAQFPVPVPSGPGPGDPGPGAGPGPAPGPAGGGGTTPPADTRKPKLTFTLAKKQKLSKKGTFAVKLTCDEACTVTLATSVKPPGRGAKTGKATKTIKLKAGKATTVNVALPKTSLSAVRKAVKRKKTVSVSLAATASDTAGNKSAKVSRKTALKR